VSHRYKEISNRLFLLLGKRLREIGTQESGEWRSLFSKVVKCKISIHEKESRLSYQRQMRGVHRKEENRYESLYLSAWTKNHWILRKVHETSSEVIGTIHC
jgi:hypothetical protein